MKQKLALLFLTILSISACWSQDESPTLSFEIPSQNLLKFNRFLINPTFSSVREENSYINLYHRNQWAQFEDSPELFFASFSGKIGERSGAGLGLYQQNFGVITNFGVLANYNYGVKLAPKSTLTFGFNLSFFNSGIDNRELFVGTPDPALASIEDNSLLSFQPGINLSVGSFDIGVFAENLVDFNLRTNEIITDFNEKTFSGHLMYTHKFKNAPGIFENGRLSALTRARRRGGVDDVNLSGSLILDLPKLGWIQGGYDDFFGIGGGIGFNLTKRLSLGYTIERGLDNGIQNLGTTHEFSFAYSLYPNQSKNNLKFDLAEDELEKLAEANNEETDNNKEDVIASKDEEIAKLKKNLDENNQILAELIFKQDSIEKAVNSEIEKRFYHLIKGFRKGNTGVTNTSSNTSNNRKDYAIGSGSATVNTPAAKSNLNTNNARANTLIEERPKADNTLVKNNNTIVNHEDFALAADANNIKHRTIRNLRDVQNGYYIVANVYSNKKNGVFYRDKFVTKLKRDGINADYIFNKRNNLNYVYLERYDNWQDAIAAYKSQLNGQYEDEVWILNIRNEDNIRYAESSSSKSKNNIASVDKKSIDAIKKSSGKDKKRIVSPTNKLPAEVVSNTNGNRVIKSPNKVQEKDADRVNTPLNTTTKVASNEKKPQRINTPVIKKDKTNKPAANNKNNNIAAQGREDNFLAGKSDDEIKQLYSSNTKKRKTAKRGRTIKVNSEEEGFYIIANVFSIPSNASRFVKLLENKGLKANYFINPENNYRYVYLEKYESWNGALAAYYSNLDDSYFDDIWIMSINTEYTL